MRDLNSSAQGRTNLIFRLKEDLVVLAQRHQEDNGGHIFETMDPFSSLGSLPSNVDHSAKESALFGFIQNTKFAIFLIKFT